MKKIMFVIKRVVIAVCMLYTFNLIISAAGYLVPINVASITVVSILGLPSVISLLILKILIK